MKKKGFTLIELLAVILILGIIALIAIPVVNKIVKESKRSSFETSARNIISVAEDECQIQSLKGETVNNTYSINNGEIFPSLDIKGKLPTSGLITLDSECKASLGMTNSTFTATMPSNSRELTIIDGTYDVYSNGTAVYFNPVSGNTCSSGEAVSTPGTYSGCMKWYAFGDSKISDTVNLILDHNTTTGAVSPWNSSGSNLIGPKEILVKLKETTASWTGVPLRYDSYTAKYIPTNYKIDYSTYRARLITATEIARIIGNNTFVDSALPHASWFYFDSNNQIQTVSSQGGSAYKWLFDYLSGCTSYGCNIANASCNGYWTASATGSEDYYKWGAWYVNGQGTLNYGNVVIPVMGVRPVITILKSEL